MDSADVWANSELFMLDDQLDPIVVSGVPPDYFSETGQLWGHPHYRWDAMERNGYEWWINRFRMMQQQADVIRIDHFRGFYNYWEVPASAETAITGEWKLGPGIPFFDVVRDALGDVPIIAEDLGDFDEESRAGLDAIQQKFNYPGMKILVFAFDTPQNIFLPHNYTRENVVYTGTHDNDTAVGWYHDSATTNDTRDFFHRYLRVGNENVAWDLIRLAWSSVADTAIAPVQDVLGYGNDAKMNTPGTVGPPNWMWRMAPNALHDGHQNGLAELTGLYNRLPDPAAM
jgi:4-alpha-glucanotransferase